MTIGKIADVALQGMQNGLQRAAKHAEEIAKGGNDQGDIVEPIIQLKLDETQVKASATVIKESEDLEQQALDILA